MSRGPWIVAGAILVAAGVVVALLLYLDKSPCEQWQRDAEATFRFVEEDLNLHRDSDVDQALDHLERLSDQRPPGCPTPD